MVGNHVGGKLLIAAFICNSLTCSLGLWYIVQRTKLCLDFSCTVSVSHNQTWLLIEIVFRFIFSICWFVYGGIQHYQPRLPGQSVIMSHFLNIHGKSIEVEDCEFVPILHKVSFITLKSNYFQVGHKLGVCGAYVRDRGVPMHEDGAEDDSCQHGWRGHNCSATQDRPSLKSWSDIHMTREKWTSMWYRELKMA